jgi:hypothetical protein
MFLLAAACTFLAFYTAGPQEVFYEIVHGQMFLDSRIHVWRSILIADALLTWMVFYGFRSAVSLKRMKVVALSHFLFAVLVAVIVYLSSMTYPMNSMVGEESTLSLMSTLICLLVFLYLLFIPTISLALFKKKLPAVEENITILKRIVNVFINVLFVYATIVLIVVEICMLFMFPMMLLKALR